ncbi:MAG: hypothetical protein WCE81_00375 [Halobacteriota archaeon]
MENNDFIERKPWLKAEISVTSASRGVGKRRLTPRSGRTNLTSDNEDTILMMDAGAI